MDFGGERRNFINGVTFIVGLPFSVGLYLLLNLMNFLLKLLGVKVLEKWCVFLFKENLGNYFAISSGIFGSVLLYSFFNYPKFIRVRRWRWRRKTKKLNGKTRRLLKVLSRDEKYFKFLKKRMLIGKTWLEEYVTLCYDGKSAWVEVKEIRKKFLRSYLLGLLKKEKKLKKLINSYKKLQYIVIK